MNQLFRLIGITKQAVQQYAKGQIFLDRKILDLVVQAEDLRKIHPGCGVEKMYHVLKPDFIGRDKFVELFMDLGFRLKKQRNSRRTTYASCVSYSNLIKGSKVNAPSTIWLYSNWRKVLLCSFHH